MSRSRKSQVMLAPHSHESLIFWDFWDSYFLSYGEFKMREIKLCMQVLQAARRLSRAAHTEPCHWSEGCHNNMGVTAGKASHNASNNNNNNMGAYIALLK